MKSILLAIICFALIWGGVYDLEPFKAQRVVRRRRVKATKVRKKSGA